MRTVLAVDDLLGRQLGEFVVREYLGQGHFGLVFRAEQATLNRDAVIKVARFATVAAVATPATASAAPVQAFLREAQLASRIDHPFAAHMYAFGHEPDGLLWMAMEFVRGTVLDVLLRQRQRLQVNEAVPLVRRLCEVVHAAHEVGIIHRDLKPANVMVVERAGSVFPKLLDLGVALDISSAAGSQQAKGPTGTPLYMAPELWVDPDTAGPQTDVYALAAMTYEMLTGEPAFNGSGVREIAASHAFKVPPRLPAMLPDQLSDVLVKAMAKRAVDRYPTALAFSDALREATSVSLSTRGPLHIERMLVETGTGSDTNEAFAIVGALAEDFAGPAIAAATREVRLNLRGISRINSGGVRAWIHWLNSVGPAVRWHFEECSFAVVQQATTISNFLPGSVTSYLVPYFCDACEDEQLTLVRPPVVPAPSRPCLACDAQATLDYPVDALDALGLPWAG